MEENNIIKKLNNIKYCNELILNNDIDLLTECDEYNRNILFYSNDIELISYIISYFDLSQQDIDGYLVLHHSIANETKYSYILNKMNGDDILLKDKSGNTILPKLIKNYFLFKKTVFYNYDIIYELDDYSRNILFYLVDDLELFNYVYSFDVGIVFQEDKHEYNILFYLHKNYYLFKSIATSHPKLIKNKLLIYFIEDKKRTKLLNKLIK